jgi:hypothetical protein
MTEPPVNSKELLAEALKPIDPTGALVPGTAACDTIPGLIQAWNRQPGPNRALDMARMGAKHRPGWRKFF